MITIATLPGMMRKMMMMMMMMMLKHSMVTEPVTDWQTNIRSITKKCIKEVSTRIIEYNGHSPHGPHLDLFFVCFRFRILAGSGHRLHIYFRITMIFLSSY